MWIPIFSRHWFTALHALQRNTIIWLIYLSRIILNIQYIIWYSMLLFRIYNIISLNIRKQLYKMIALLLRHIFSWSSAASIFVNAAFKSSHMSIVVNNPRSIHEVGKSADSEIRKKKLTNQSTVGKGRGLKRQNPVFHEQCVHWTIKHVYMFEYQKSKKWRPLSDIKSPVVTWL